MYTSQQVHKVTLPPRGGKVTLCMFQMFVRALYSYVCIIFALYNHVLCRIYSLQPWSVSYVLFIALSCVVCALYSPACVVFANRPSTQARVHKITYAHINFTALCVMLFMGEVQYSGGFLGPKSHSPDGSCDFMGSKKVSIPGPNPPCNVLARMNNITHGAVKFTGA